jgi:sugar phosphate isomerase/epimerase
MAKIPIGLQLFSVRGEVSKDLSATLKSVASIGYVGVEPWGYSGDKLEWMGHDPKDMRKMLDDNGLKCCGIHLATGALIGDNLNRTIELNQILGNKFLIIAADSQRMKTKDSIMELAEILNDACDKLKPLDMFTGYHAHGFDFADIDGKPAWDILFANTKKDVIMQMDIGNCASGGGDPIGELRQFSGRARSVHLKDYGGPEDSVIGEGIADWKEIFRLCEEEHNTEWYVVEEGSRDGMGFEICKRSLESLKRMGK